jgi:hypothetical protein
MKEATPAWPAPGARSESVRGQVSQCGLSMPQLRMHQAATPGVPAGGA